MQSNETTRRREFLISGGVMTAGLAAGVGAAPRPDPRRTLPTMQLGQHEVSRLVLGSNPIGGYAHFNRQLGDLFREYYTDENTVALFHAAHDEGVNLLQGHTDEKIVRCLLKFRESGKTLHWMFVTNMFTEQQGQGSFRISLKNPHVQEAVRLCQPIALVHHGEETDDLFKQGPRQFEQVNDAFKRIADMGMIPGMSTHLPQTIAYVEEKGWDCRFYMGCFYRCGKVKPDEWKQQTGLTPIGELYTEEMPDETCRILRQVRKPCFGYKILAAGRKTKTATEIEDCYRYAFQHLKPNDGIIVGVFQKFENQIQVAADLTRKFAIA